MSVEYSEDLEIDWKKGPRLQCTVFSDLPAYKVQKAPPFPGVTVDAVSQICNISRFRESFYAASTSKCECQP